MFEDILDNQAFWVLAGFGVGAEVLGFVIARNAGWETFPLWQFILLILGTLVGCAFIANRE